MRSIFAPGSLLTLALTLIAWSVAAAPASAQFTYTWQPTSGGTVYDGFFTDGSHWTNTSGDPELDFTSPGAGDTVVINAVAGQPYTVTGSVNGNYIGSLTLSTAQATLTGPFNVGDAVTVSAGTFTGDLTVGGSFGLTNGGTFSGTGTFSGPVTADSGTLFQLTGAVAGPANFTINGALDFNNGAFNGTGTMTANGPVTVTGASSVGGSATLVLNGPTTAGANLTVGSGGLVRLSAGVTMTDTGNNTFGGFNGGGTFDIQGSFVKNGGTGTTTLVGNLAAGGLIRAQTGTIYLQANSAAGQSTYAGTLQADSGAAVSFGAGGTHLVPAGSTATLTGAGTFRVDGGTLRVDGTAAVVSPGGLQLAASGTLTGTGTVTGLVVAGNGSVIAPGNGTPTGSLTLGAALTFGNGAGLQVTGGASGSAPLHLTGPLTAASGTDQFAVSLKGGSDLTIGQGYTWTLIHSDVPLTGITPANFTFAASDFNFSGATFNVGTNDVTVNFTVVPVPEPSGILGLAAGVGLAGWVRRRRRRVLTRTAV